MFTDEQLKLKGNKICNICSPYITKWNRQYYEFCGKGLWIIQFTKQEDIDSYIDGNITFNPVYVPKDSLLGYIIPSYTLLKVCDGYDPEKEAHLLVHIIMDGTIDGIIMKFISE